MRIWRWTGSSTAALTLVVASLLWLSAKPAEPPCPAEKAEPMVPTDRDLCRRLAATVRSPGELPLRDYQLALSRFFDNWCHRDVESGWARDERVRDTGPFTTDVVDGVEHPRYHGTHAPVVIWYSPEMAEWVRTNRSGGRDPAQAEEGVPEGAILVKEMFPAPAARCADVDPKKLLPTSGAAFMVRAPEVSKDGWYWGWYGWSGWDPDVPADQDSNRLAYQGFGQYCVNCHATARGDFTFSDAANMAGEPGTPISYLSQATIAGDRLPDSHHAPSAAPESANEVTALADYAASFLSAYPSPERGRPSADTVVRMPSQTYDNVFSRPEVIPEHPRYLTSDQCLGCHDAGSTGLQFDMTERDPDGRLWNHSPYGTWTSSPMGLAGRDPIFFAQLASETQSFHPDEAATVENVCLGCHGVMGQRQFTQDEFDAEGDCTPFSRSTVDAAPWPEDAPDVDLADYGALARDGISCLVCHTMAVGEEANGAVEAADFNHCAEERQQFLNPGHTGFAKTFTGSFLRREGGEVIGPFENPRTWPMDQSLGRVPEHDESVTSSEICGTCHTVHLPVLHEGRTVGRVYEQTTYAEWAFSDFRVGWTVDHELPFGPGATPESCQECHMPDTDDSGAKVKSKIASIQEVSNFPETAFTVDAEKVDLPVREGYSRHTLVGLNLFLVSMARQFPDVLGIRVQDPMLVDKGVDPLEFTEAQMVEQARTATTEVEVTDARVRDKELEAEVRVTNLVGHKFPSGVGFRRAILGFEVLDATGDVLWSSGSVDRQGRVLDGEGRVLPGELWWEDDCSSRIEPDARVHQAHYQEISRQDQAQIYQELVSTPPLGEIAPDSVSCGHDAPPAGQLTTSFLSICAEVKDNRLLPAGYLAPEQRVAIAEALGAGAELGLDAGSTAVGDDPDYHPGAFGGDHVRYSVPLADLGGEPVAVRARLRYQATPPFYLQDRFCTARGPDRDRLYYLAGHLDVEDTPIEDWSLVVGDSGLVSIGD